MICTSAIIAQFNSDGTFSCQQNLSTASAYQKDSNTDTVHIINQIPSPAILTLDITYDGNHLWVGGFMDSCYFKISPTDGSVIKTISTKGNITPRGMTFINNYLYVTNSENRKIYKVDTLNGDTVFSFSSPDPGNNLYPSGLAWDGQYIWQTEGGNLGPHNVYKIDTLGNVIKTFHSIYGSGGGLTFPVNTLFSSENYYDRIIEYDTTNLNVISEYLAPGGDFPNGMAFDGQYLWLGNGYSNFLYQIDVGIASSSRIFNYSNLIVISAYPNPCFNFATFHINLKEVPKEVSLRIYNYCGQIMLCENNVEKDTRIDFSVFPRGIYVYTLVSELSTIGIGKIVKE